MISSIRAKLLSGISLILILLLFSLFWIVKEFTVFNEKLNRIVDRSAERVILSDDILYALMEVVAQEKNFLLEKDKQAASAHEDTIRRNISNADAQIRRLETLVSEQGKVYLTSFAGSWEEYKEALQEVVELKQAGQLEDAVEQSSSASRQKRMQAVASLNQLIDSNKARMQADKKASNESYAASLRLIITLIVIALLLSGLLTYWLIHSITKRIRQISDVAQKIASRDLSEMQITLDVQDELRPLSESLNDILHSFRDITFSANKVAEGDYYIKIEPRSEKDVLGHALKQMTASLAETTEANKERNWMISGLLQLNERLSGEQNIEAISNNAIGFLAEYIHSQIGALYLLQAEGTLKLSGSFAYAARKEKQATFALGESLVGEAARKKDVLHVRDYREQGLKIASSLVETHPREVVLTPFFLDDQLLGVIELAKIEAFSEAEIAFLKSTLDVIAININTALNRDKIQDLLNETQAQSEELQLQQDDLRKMNVELEEQTQNLKFQQEELQVANEELEEQSSQLELKNKQLELAQAELERKSREVEESSRYKSEFLANMSHELRTPLNSLLILSKDLADNREKNLNETQIESAGIIYKSGKDLLQLINEVLDLSKIEAGKMDLNVEELDLADFVDSLKRNFRHAAQKKKLDLSLQIDPALPSHMATDPQRLGQIIKNLLSNAIKFTEKGGVSLHIRKASDTEVTFEVQDSGIGIPKEKQALIFEAFQQADGSTSRRYGGTGLGLSISRQLAQLLGGEITLQSEENKGSCFTLRIPLSLRKLRPSAVPIPQPERRSPIIQKNESFVNYPTIADERETVSADDKSLLIIEDDLRFAEILKKQAQAKGFKVLAASTGEDGLTLAEKHKPKAIILDLVLPGMQGRLVLNELKSNPDLRHIPVHVISSNERTLDLIREGAMEYLTKPIEKDQLEEALMRIENFIQKKMKNLLVVEDDENLRKSIKILIGSSDIRYFEAGTGAEALEIIQKEAIDCVVLDLGLPDISGFELIKTLQQQKGVKIPPIIIYTGKELSREENDELQNFAETIIIKGVKSEERLLDETALFLHRMISELPEAKKDILLELHSKEAVFHGKKVLVVDDDMRNVFALSKVLKEQGMEIIKAENGLKAIEALHEHEQISIVLMDVMMPVMDGLEAMRKIRTMSRFKDLPIIAITAKAMKEDRAKCIEAGANDYISKPVDIEQLLSLMRIWIKNMNY